TIVARAFPDNADTCMAVRMATGSVVMENVAETLVKINYDTGELQPGLATSWERINDTTWRFKLREGVKFHDGAPFNAEAIVKTIERVRIPELGCNDWAKYFGDL